LNEGSFQRLCVNQTVFVSIQSLELLGQFHDLGRVQALHQQVLSKGLQLGGTRVQHQMLYHAHVKLSLEFQGFGPLFKKGVLYCIDCSDACFVVTVQTCFDEGLAIITNSIPAGRLKYDLLLGYRSNGIF